MKKIFTTALIFASSFALADTPAPAADSYSYEQINQVADYLGAKVESPTKKILSCDQSAEKSTQLLSGPVRELIDQKRPEEIKKFREDAKAYISKVKGCSSRCSCNGFSLMLSDLSDQSGSNDYKDLDTLLTSETKRLTKDQSLRCAKKLKWFCKSKLRSSLANN